MGVQLQNYKKMESVIGLQKCTVDKTPFRKKICWITQAVTLTLMSFRFTINTFFTQKNSDTATDWLPELASGLLVNLQH